MTTSIIAVLIVIAGIAAYLWVFHRLRNKNMGDLLDEAINDATPEGIPGVTQESESDKPTEIFKAVDEVSNTQSCVGYAGDTSVTTTMSFEEKIGKDTIVVEIPDKKARRTETREKAIAAKADVVRKAPEKTPDTAEELIVKLKRKIARRIDVLKLAGIPEGSDKTLAKYRADLKKLTDSVKKVKAEAKAAAKASKTAVTEAPKAVSNAAQAKVEKTTKKKTEKATKLSKKATTRKASGKSATKKAKK